MLEVSDFGKRARKVIAFIVSPQNGLWIANLSAIVEFLICIVKMLASTPFFALSFFLISLSLFFKEALIVSSLNEKELYCMLFSLTIYGHHSSKCVDYSSSTHYYTPLLYTAMV